MVAFLGLLILGLQVVKIRHVPHIGNHHDDVPVIAEAGRTGDEGPLAGAEGLLQRHRLAAGEGQQGARLAHHALPLQIPHIPAHHILLPQAADGQVRRVYPKGVRPAVGDIDAVIGAVHDGLQPVIGLLKASKHPVDLFLRHDITPLWLSSIIAENRRGINPDLC